MTSPRSARPTAHEAADLEAEAWRLQATEGLPDAMDNLILQVTATDVSVFL